MAPRRGEKREESVAVAIDRDKASQYAIKWTVENLLGRGQALTLLHIKTRAGCLASPEYVASSNHVAVELGDEAGRGYRQQLDIHDKDLFLPFRCFCMRKEIQCNEVIMEETDIARGIIEYVAMNSIEVLVLAAP